MSIVYRWIEHTGELELAISAEAEEEVFAEGILALGELLGAGEDDRAVDSRRIDVTAPDRATLLAELLGEVVFRAEVEGLVPQRASNVSLDDGSLSVVLEGRPGDPPHLIKAITYHRLSFEPAPDGWHATVVLDV